MFDGAVHFTVQHTAQQRIEETPLNPHNDEVSEQNWITRHFLLSNKKDKTC